MRKIRMGDATERQTVCVIHKANTITTEKPPGGIFTNKQPCSSRVVRSPFFFFFRFAHRHRSHFLLAPTYFEANLRCNVCLNVSSNDSGAFGHQ